ncbi:ORF-138 [Teiidae poxvirus 1]|nr:ORF-138 [Teiidae poxvirus 1]
MTSPALPRGLLLEDMAKNKWVLGNYIASGGFGLIYDTISVSNSRCIAKIEKSESGGLFCEINFYNRVMRNTEVVSNWKLSNQVSHLGIPTFYGFGLFTYNRVRYRFMILQKLGNDLDKLLVEKRRFNLRGICTLATNILTILEFLHDNGFSHGDIKAGNILLGLENNRIYLVDYGLATKFVVSGEHKSYTKNPKNRHNGTLFFACLDAHNGVTVSRRGDLESLGYCMVKWFQGSLPWEQYEKNPEAVQKCKEEFLKNLFESEQDVVIYNYLKKVARIGYLDKPDYTGLKEMFL